MSSGGFIFGIFMSFLITSVVMSIMWTSEMESVILLVDCNVDYDDIPNLHKDDLFEKCNPELVEELDDKGVQLTYKP